MGKRTIAGVLNWATAIVVGITAFVGAVIGLGEQISKFRVAVFGNAAAADAKDGFETVLVDDTPPLDNAFQSIEAPTPEPIVTPSNDPNDYRVGDEIYKMEPVTFTVKPPDETKEPIMTPPCSCVRRDDHAQKVEVFNTCSANAKIILMKYPHYPLKSFQPLPVKEGRELSGKITYGAVTLSPKQYIRVTYSLDSLVDIQVTACSTG